ncbi:putative tail fiber assembly protein [Vibrio phage pVa-21]|nr:putative tail fiber assembly protein [Vibrio phage pVa-21]
MAIVLLNPDNTVNYIGTTLEGLFTEGLEVLEINSRTPEEIQNNVYPEFAVWDRKHNLVRDVRQRPELLIDGKSDADRQRATRDALLGILDTYVSNPLRWNALTEEQQQALTTYREKLLDVPQQGGFPARIVWPKAPAFLPRS